MRANNSSHCGAVACKEVARLVQVGVSAAAAAAAVGNQEEVRDSLHLLHHLGPCYCSHHHCHHHHRLGRVGTVAHGWMVRWAAAPWRCLCHGDHELGRGCCHGGVLLVLSAVEVDDRHHAASSLIEG